jgi:hypothetical protein
MRWCHTGTRRIAPFSSSASWRENLEARDDTGILYELRGDVLAGGNAVSVTAMAVVISG